MPALKEIVDLVEKCSRRFSKYRSSKHKELELQDEFLNPFFSALRWDVNNRQMDTLVYELYRLTEEEIRIVEEAPK